MEDATNASVSLEVYAIIDDAAGVPASHTLRLLHPFVRADAGGAFLPGHIHAGAVASLPDALPALKLKKYALPVADLPVNEAFVKALHAHPFVHALLGALPAAAAAPAGGKGGAAAPAAGKKGDAGGAGGAAALPGERPFMGWVPLDVSPLLAGQPSVSVTYGSVAPLVKSLGTAALAAPPPAAAGAKGGKAPAPAKGAAPAPAPAEAPPAPPDPAAVTTAGLAELCKALGMDVASPGTRSAAWELSPEGEATAPPLLPPAGLSFLHVAVRVTAAAAVAFKKLPDAPAAAAAAPAGKGAKPAAAAKEAPKKGAVAGPSPGAVTPPPGYELGEVTALVPPRLVSDAGMRCLLPCTIALSGVRGAPASPEGAPVRAPYLLARTDGWTSETGPSPGPFLLPQAGCKLDVPDSLCAGPSAWPPPRLAVAPAASLASTEGQAAVDLSCSLTSTVCLSLCGAGAAAGSTPAAVGKIAREVLRTRPLPISLHDRDGLAWEALTDGESAAAAAAAPAPAPAADAAATSGAPASTSGLDAVRASGARLPRASLAATLLAPAPAPAPPPAPVDPKAKGGKAAAPASADKKGSAPAEAAPPPLSLSELMAALYPPSSWGLPTLPPSRAAALETMLTGTGPCPFEAVHKHGEAAAAAAASAAAAAAAGAKGGKGGAAPAGGASSDPSIVAHPLPDVDRVFVAQLFARLLGAGERHGHGAALLRVDLSTNQLLHAQERAAVAASGEEGAEVNALGAIVTEPVFPQARSAVSPYPETALLALPIPDQRLVKSTADYTSAGTRLVGAASLKLPRHDPAAAAAAHDALHVERLVVRFPYAFWEDELLYALLGVVEDHNLSALEAFSASSGEALPGPLTSSSFRTLQLSPAALAAVNAGTLDLLTGFQVLEPPPRGPPEAGFRTFVIEGSCAAMTRLRNTLPLNTLHELAISYATGESSEPITFLCNPDISFPSPRRTYLWPAGAQTPCIKELRLREPLEALRRQPRLYTTTGRALAASGGAVAAAEDPAAVAAMDALSHLLACDTLGTAYRTAGSVFPTAAGLSALERGFGDVLTLRDLFGAFHPAAHAVEEATLRLAAAGEVLEDHRSGATDPSQTLKGALEAAPPPPPPPPPAPRRWYYTRSRKYLVPIAVEQDNTTYLSARAAAATARAARDYVNTVNQDTVAMLQATRGFTLANTSRAQALSASATAALAPGVELVTTGTPGDGFSALAATLSTRPGAGEIDYATLPVYGSQRLVSGVPGAAPPGDDALAPSPSMAAAAWQGSLRAPSAQMLAAGAAAAAAAGASANGVALATDAAKALYKTTDGFVWPVARTPAELAAHPKRPTDARIEDLAVNRFVDPYEASVIAEATIRREAFNPSRPTFDTVPEPHALARTGGCFEPHPGTVHGLEGNLQALEGAQLTLATGAIPWLRPNLEGGRTALAVGPMAKGGAAGRPFGTEPINAELAAQWEEAAARLAAEAAQRG